MSDPGGLVLKGDDGSLYFIRNEVLEAAKLEGEYLDNAQAVIEADAPEVEGFALTVNRGGFTPIGQFQAPLDLKIKSPSSQIPNLGEVASTVMCPW